MDLYAPYKVVERALARVYGADNAARRGAFRARLDNLKRAKVLGVNPGKGQRNTYDLKQISKLLVALELEIGVTPGHHRQAVHRAVGVIQPHHCSGSAQTAPRR